MANNRLYIYDPETNSAAMLAKSYAEGWFVFDADSKNDRLSKKLDMFFEGLNSNKWADKSTELKLLIENELPEDCNITNADSVETK